MSKDLSETEQQIVELFESDEEYDIELSLSPVETMTLLTGLGLAIDQYYSNNQVEQSNILASIGNEINEQTEELHGQVEEIAKGHDEIEFEAGDKKGTIGRTTMPDSSYRGIISNIAMDFFSGRKWLVILVAITIGQLWFVYDSAKKGQPFFATAYAFTTGLLCFSIANAISAIRRGIYQ